MKEMKCEVCGKKFFCNGDRICHESATECFCKDCSIKKWGKEDIIEMGEHQECYGGIIEKERVEFT